MFRWLLVTIMLELVPNNDLYFSCHLPDRVSPDRESLELFNQYYKIEKLALVVSIGHLYIV